MRRMPRHRTCRRKGAWPRGFRRAGQTSRRPGLDRGLPAGTRARALYSHCDDRSRIGRLAAIGQWHGIVAWAVCDQIARLALWWVWLCQLLAHVRYDALGPDSMEGMATSRGSRPRIPLKVAPPSNAPLTSREISTRTGVNVLFRRSRPDCSLLACRYAGRRPCGANWCRMAPTPLCISRNRFWCVRRLVMAESAGVVGEITCMSAEDVTVQSGTPFAAK